METTTSHVLIVGAGAIGGSLAGYLHRAGRRVTIVDPWFTHIDRVRRDGLQIESPEEVFTTHPPALHIDELEQLEDPADVLVIATKGYDTEWAYRLADPYARPEAPVLFAQNGIIEDLVPRYVPVERVVGCVVSMAAEIFDPGHVRRTLTKGWPTLTLGELDPTNGTDRVRALQDLFAPAGEIRSNEDIMAELWSKLALNAMTNGIGALTGATTRVIWGDDRFLPVTVAACAETAKVATAAGVAIEPVFGRIAIDALLGAYDGDTGSRDEVIGVLKEISDERTGARENKPSMLQDHLKGRRTEIDYINGHVVRYGTRVGVATPVNAAAVRLVHDLEQGRRPQRTENIDDLLAAVPTS